MAPPPVFCGLTQYPSFAPDIPKIIFEFSIVLCSGNFPLFADKE